MCRDLDTRTLLRPTALNCPLGSQDSGTDILTLIMYYVEFRDHEQEVPHYLLELDLVGVEVFIVSHVLLHQ